MNTQLSATMDLRWLASFPASCVHAAEAMARGQLIADPRMAEAIAERAQLLRQTIVAAGLPRTAFWRNLLGLSDAAEGSTQLAIRAVTKTIGAVRGESLVSSLAASITGVEVAVCQAFPNMLEELGADSSAAAQWGGRGPGLLRGIARWTDPHVIAENAQVILVDPSLGGGGWRIWHTTMC